MYTINPFMPKVRMQAVLLVKIRGWSMRKVSRYMGVSPGTISKWCRKASLLNNRYSIPTESSRPHHSPNRVLETIRDAIVAERLKHKRCGAVIHKTLLNRNISVSLSTVNRVLDRGGFLKKRSKWKRYHRAIERPLAMFPGDLVQLDTIHIQPDISNRDKSRVYIYTLLDVYSRWTYAEAFETINTWNSLIFLKHAQQLASFDFKCIQTDHGQEFSTHFTENSKIRHRHIRIRKPNDNGHLERFNRTLQDECIKYPTKDIKEINQWIRSYLSYYNNERLHMGINFLTPAQKLAQVFPRS